MFAEDLVDLLSQKNLISPDLITGLRGRLVKTPKTIPAEVFADRLVEQGVLTASLAQALLRQLTPEKPLPLDGEFDKQYDSPSEAVAAEFGEIVIPSVTKQSPPPLPPIRPSQTDRIPSRSAGSSPIPGQTARISPAAEAEGQSIEGQSIDFTKKRWEKKRKKSSQNPWDTKLILLGGGGVLALLLLALFLTGSLFRRSADSMLAMADQSYEKAIYSQAIVEYDRFLKAYPNHSGASTARIRIALSRIRLVVDAKSDWINAYNTAAEEIETVENEPNFFEESKAELAVLLPKIASGLVAEAKEKTSLFHAERAELTLQMIDKLLPRSLRPVEQLAEVKSQIREIRRVLFRDNAFKETDEQLNKLLDAVPFDAKVLAECFSRVDSLLKDYPELASDLRFQETGRRISESAGSTVRFHSGNLSIRDRSDMKTSFPEAKRPGRFLAMLYDRNLFREVSIAKDRRVVLPLCGEKTLYGIEASDGKPLWKQSFGADLSVAAVSRILVAFETKSLSRSSFLLADTEQGIIELVDAQTGKSGCDISIDEPFFLSEIAQSDVECQVAVTTKSGRLTLLSIQPGTMEILVSSQLPQSVDSAPVVDLKKRTVYQLADRDTLYAVSLNGEAERTVARSVHVGQVPATVRIAPVMFGSNLLIVCQTGVRTCELLVLTTLPNGGREILQRFPIRGLVDAPIAVDGRFFALTSDEGDAQLFEQAEDAQAPVRCIAQGAAGRDTGKSGVVRFAALSGKDVWIADWQLMRFEPQLTQFRLLPKESLQRDIVTAGPMIRIKNAKAQNVLFHVFRNQGFGGTRLEAVSPVGISIDWDTEVADRIVREPVISQIESGSRLTFYSSAGKSWTIDLPTPQGAVEFTPIQPTLALPRGVFGKLPLGNVLELQNGFQAWIAKEPRTDKATDNRLIKIFDPEASERNRFRSLYLPALPATEAVEFHANLLVPLRNGQVVLLEPKSGEFVAEPFAPLSSDRQSPLWTAPIVLPPSGAFLIVDNRPDENGNVSAYLVEDRTVDGKRQLVSPRRFRLEQPVSSRPAFLGKHVVWIDSNRNINALDPTSDDRDTSFEISGQLAAPCVWGPFTAEDSILFATEDGILHRLDVDLKYASIALPVPVGRPRPFRGNVLLNSADGIVRLFSPNDLKVLFSVETGIETSLGSVVADDRIVLCGNDGCVYDITIPAMREDEKKP